MGLNRELGYELEKKWTGNVFKVYAKFECVSCNATYDVSVGSGKMNPEMIAKRPGRAGWHVDAYRKAKTFCPACAGSSVPAEDEQPLIGEIDRSFVVIDEIPIELPEESVDSMGRWASPVDKMPVANDQPAHPLMLEAPTTRKVVKPSTDQRMAIRNLLDKHFDDAKGMYLDDMSDQVIADQVRVPRDVVEQIREIGYGPIRVDPMIMQLRAELLEIKGRIDAERDALSDHQNQITALGEASDRIEAGLNAEQAKLHAVIEKIERLQNGQS